MHTYKEGNIQERSRKNNTEELWDDFGRELKRENPKGFNYQGGTSNSSNNSLQDHVFARNAKFDFVFSFTDWDTQIYENMPGYEKGNFTGNLKEWMWDYNFILNIEVKRVGLGSLASVLPKRFREAFNIPYQDRNKWLITDFSNVLKIVNWGGILYVYENGDQQVHHIFHEEDISNACICGYHMDWEGDPNKAGGGGYKAKTLLNKEHSIKFESFEEVKAYIRSMADCKLWQQKETNRRLFHKNLINKKTYILEYSPNKVGKQDPIILHEGLLKPAPKKQITCEEVEANE